jgi:Replicative DNA helicase
MFECTPDSIARLHKIANQIKENDITGIPSGFTGLDRMTGGWQPADLVIVGSRPSMGKTAFMLSMAHNMAINHKCNVALFSLEMSVTQLVKRMNQMGIEQKEMHNRPSGQDKWCQFEQLSKATIFIDDMPVLSKSEFCDKCTQLVLQHNVRIVFIDYLQLLSWGRRVRQQRGCDVSNTLRVLKDIAKELNITIIALSQLRRKANTQDGSPSIYPKLSDFCADELEIFAQNADVVTLIYRPEYYGHTEDESGSSLEGVAEILITKNRNGKLGNVRLTFNSDNATFMEH